jgi:hypothetical protein
MLPFHIYGIRSFHKYCKDQNLKPTSVSPSLIEKLIGLISLTNLVVLSWYKAQSESMVFMLNPCHLISVLLIFVCFNDFNQWTERAAVWIYATAYGAWIGLFFTENDGLP